MQWNPYLNACAASAYIGGVALLFQFINSVRANTPDMILDPIAALSLLVFSVAVMGFLFFYNPVTMLLDGKRREAVTYFAKTLGTFGAITVLLFAALSAL